ncbi:hypothetical protein [Symbiobacterium terraclitae]
MLLYTNLEIVTIASGNAGVVPAAAGGRAHARNSRHVPARSA